MNTKNTLDILTYLVESGTIDLDVVQNQLNVMKRHDYLKKHPYEIYQSNGRWCTYIPDDSKKSGRRLKAVKDREKLEDYIIQYYKDLENLDLTIGQTFRGWLEEKKLSVEKSTINRYEQDYKRFLYPYHEQKIKKYDNKNAIISLCKEIIRKHNLDKKGFSKLKLILTGMFKYSYIKDITTLDIVLVFKCMEIPEKLFKKKIVDEKAMTFSKTELPRIVDFLVNSDHPIDAGLLLLFKTGLRVGEVVALKKNDFLSNGVRIKNMEIRYKENGSYHYEVVDRTKTSNGDRLVLIPEHDMWIVDKVLSLRGNNLKKGYKISEDAEDYIFLNSEGRRAYTNVFRARLYRVCEKVLDLKKSPHKIRKTYCTILLDAKLPDNLILKQVGHGNISTTKKYYHYNRETEQEKQQENEKNRLLLQNVL